MEFYQTLEGCPSQQITSIMQALHVEDIFTRLLSLTTVHTLKQKKTPTLVSRSGEIQVTPHTLLLSLWAFLTCPSV